MNNVWTVYGTMYDVRALITKSNFNDISFCVHSYTVLQCYLLFPLEHMPLGCYLMINICSLINIKWNKYRSVVHVFIALVTSDICLFYVIQPFCCTKPSRMTSSRGIPIIFYFNSNSPDIFDVFVCNPWFILTNEKVTVIDPTPSNRLSSNAIYSHSLMTQL